MFIHSVRRCRMLTALFLVGILSDGLLAADWFAAPDGKRSNEGTMASPWDVASAVSGQKPVKPGDMVWLRAGTYRNAKSEFVLNLSGETSRPVTVRNYRNERVTIDGALTIGGSDVWVWGLEVIVSEPRPDAPMPAGSHPTELKRPWGGIQSNTSRRSKIINCIVHDTCQGFSYWLAATDAEIYGCLIYQNGWVGVDRTHGHAIYTQNDKGTKWIVDNTMFDPYSYLLHAYGSSRAFVNGYHVEGNIFFGGTVLIGGGKPSERITFVKNFTYKAPTQFGYTAPYNEDVVCRGNYFASDVSVNRYKKALVTDNEFVGGAKGSVELPAGGTMSDIAWDHNRYIAASPAALNAWRAKTGLDKNGVVTTQKNTRVFIRPNKYERGRANVCVYNWEGKSSVEINLQDILEKGQSYEIRNVQDFYGQPVVSGTYRGGNISIPLLRGAKKVELKLSGDPTGRVWDTFGDYPDFDAFILLPVVNN